MNKKLNAQCVCNNHLMYNNMKVVMLKPCEHMIHYDCYIAQDTNNCKICGETIKGIYAKNPENNQRMIDILSVTDFSNDTKININTLLKNLFNILYVSLSVPFINKIEDGTDICRKILKMNNVKLTIEGYEKTEVKGKKIYIANHSSQIDCILLFYVLRCGFVLSSSLKDIIFLKHITDTFKCVYVERGKKKNTVKKIKKYFEKNDSLCMFPEGMVSHPSTLVNFRTGAFNVGVPIIPIVIKYDNAIISNNYYELFAKMASGNNINVEMTFLDIEYPPFDKSDIEKIRTKIANKGEFMLSRVSNIDINDFKQ
uniref:Phospholipid/glycerol acyltransferase domain-containing protein n=1 Tax=viral metagenome TaxID=1070528 RepID=A0A6C0EBX8_9ZZZZ